MDTMDEYLGDGVYASYDGYHVWLDLRAQDSSRIALDPAVLAAFDEYRRKIQSRLRKTKSAEEVDS
jgi:hypothetical protein